MATHNGRTTPTQFSNLLREYRQMWQLTQYELEDISGVSRLTIATIENGKVINPSTLATKALADTFCLEGPERDYFFAAAGRKTVPPPMSVAKLSPVVLRLQMLIDKLNETQRHVIESFIEKTLTKLEGALHEAGRSAPRPLKRLRGYSPQGNVPAHTT